MLSLVLLSFCFLLRLFSSFSFSIFSLWQFLVFSFVPSQSLFLFTMTFFYFLDIISYFFPISFLNLLLLSFLCLHCVHAYLHIRLKCYHCFIIHISIYFCIPAFLAFYSCDRLLPHFSLRKGLLPDFSVLFVLRLLGCSLQFHISLLFSSVLVSSSFL